MQTTKVACFPVSTSSSCNAIPVLFPHACLMILFGSYFWTSGFWIPNLANYLCWHFSNLHFSWHYVGIVRQISQLFSDLSWDFESSLDYLRKIICFWCIYTDYVSILLMVTATVWHWGPSYLQRNTHTYP